MLFLLWLTVQEASQSQPQRSCHLLSHNVKHDEFYDLLNGSRIPLLQRGRIGVEPSPDQL